MEPGIGGTGFEYCEKLEEWMVKEGVLRQMFQGYEDLRLLSHQHRLAQVSNSFDIISRM